MCLALLSQRVLSHPDPERFHVHVNSDKSLSLLVRLNEILDQLTEGKSLLETLVRLEETLVRPDKGRSQPETLVRPDETLVRLEVSA